MRSAAPVPHASLVSGSKSRPHVVRKLAVAVSLFIEELVSFVVDANDADPAGPGAATLPTLFAACLAIGSHCYTSAMSPKPLSSSTVLTVRTFSLPAAEMVTVHSSSAKPSIQKSPQLLVVSV